MDVNGMEEVIGMMGHGVVEGIEAGGGTGAQWATGPRTEEGKAVSSKNALKHGLTAARAENAVDPELKAQYEALRRQYLDDFRPEGAIENTLMDLVVLAAWQLYKIRQMEMFARVDLGEPGEVGKSEKLARYRGHHERLLFRSLNQLRQIQQERAELRVERSAALPERLAPGVKVKPLAMRVERSRKQPRVMKAGVGGSAGEATGPLRRALVMRREKR
jgi:hypothetical protein